ncbi:hypothetical protein [Massilia haematophila]|uniref:LysR substrate-binding domain-containing protein n=1 Tax=Massilia haematophila TaxID=457923 RepID=A0ABV7PN88_9BURK
MSPGDFGLSVFASWLANKLDTFLKTPVSEGATHTTVQSAAIPAEEQRSEGPEIKRTARFRTFDSARDFDTLLRTVSEPVISILIEDTPSTSYRLPSMVLESRVTGEWFVFPRMRMSFEGNGGGLRNARDTFDLIRLVGANVGAWVVPQQVLDSLDNGYLVWAEVRPTAIPLLAVISGEHSWSEIERNVQRFLAPPTPEE